MKKIATAIILFLLAIVFTISGCQASFIEAEAYDPINTEQPSQLDHINNLEGVSLTALAVRADANQIKVVFLNTSEKNCIYGSNFSIEQETNGTWYQVPYSVDGPVSWNTIGYSLEPGASNQVDIDWSWPYGKLPTGHYRLIKSILDFRGTGDHDTYILAAEFSID
ncbi:hypothetical protein JW979_00565 [bacterium]|nr:hypothetical protein [candidate division CSSED10-310 bacterium]